MYIYIYIGYILLIYILGIKKQQRMTSSECPIFLSPPLMDFVGVAFGTIFN